MNQEKGGTKVANAMNVIYPYKIEGIWVFDDERVGLDQEPFVDEANEIIEAAFEMKGIENADTGFRLMFSGGEFPNYDLKFEWVRAGEGGNWYRAERFELEGWLCPALLKYFDAPPKEIYARIGGFSFEARRGWRGVQCLITSCGVR